MEERIATLSPLTLTKIRQLKELGISIYAHSYSIIKFACMGYRVKEIAELIESI